MAMEMEAGDLWLPSEFLANDFFLQGEPYYNRGNLRSEFPSVEPAPGTESDEEDYLAELTRQMAHAFLKENDDDEELSLLARDNPKHVMAGSPQSTLCDLGVWSGSGKGSPNGPSQVSSPPSTPFDQGKDDSWDLLTAAAGQVVRLRLNDNDGRGLLGPPAPVTAKVSLPIPAPLKRSATTIGGLYSAPHLTQQQLQTERFYQLKQQQLMKQQASAAWGRQLNRGKGGGGGSYGEGHCGRPLGLPCSAWPPLQRQQQHQHQHQHQQGQPGSGMRAVFLTGSRARKESTGTGVFLPRRPGAPSSDVRKKPACSTVLLPDRVIQALNLNLSDMVPHHPRFPGDSMVARGNAYLAHQKRNHYRPQPVAPTIQEQLRLPAEWTY